MFAFLSLADYYQSLSLACNKLKTLIVTTKYLLSDLEAIKSVTKSYNHMHYFIKLHIGLYHLKPVNASVKADGPTVRYMYQSY